MSAGARLLLSTFVAGQPRPKGSMKTHIIPGGAAGAGQKCPRCKTPLRVKLTEASEHGPAWRAAVASGARDAQKVMRAEGVLAAGTERGSVAVWLTFWFDRGAFLGPLARELTWPIANYIGDEDKLERNVLDALTDAGVYDDDRQVVRIESVKSWAPFGMSSGAQVSVWTMG